MMVICITQKSQYTNKQKIFRATRNGCPILMTTRKIEYEKRKKEIRI